MFDFFRRRRREQRKYKASYDDALPNPNSENRDGSLNSPDLDLQNNTQNNNDTVNGGGAEEQERR